MTDMCHPTLNLGFLLKGCKGEVAGEEHMKKQLWNDGRILRGGGGERKGRRRLDGEGEEGRGGQGRGKGIQKNRQVE